MAIVDTINSIKEHLGEAYASLEEKQATIPSNKNIENLADTILTIPSGGEPVEVIEKDINFYDYDGTLLYSYTKNEMLNMTNLPANPSHSGLVAQGWNWNIDDIKTYLESHTYLNVGQLYTTSDGYTRLYINVLDELKDFYFGMAVNGTLGIDWGDGSTSLLTGTSTLSRKTINHKYANSGKYIITLRIVNGSANILGASNVSGLFSSTTTVATGTDIYSYLNMLYKVEMGDSILISSYAFAFCSKLETISISNTSKIINDGNFANCHSLKHINFNNQNTSLTNNSFQYCYSLKRICLNKEITSIGSYAFHTCSTIRRITMPDSITIINNYAFYNDRCLEKIEISKNITSFGTNTLNGCDNLYEADYGICKCPAIGNYTYANCTSLVKGTIPYQATKILDYAFNNTYSLKEVIVPSTVTSVGNMAFASSGILRYDFSRCTQIPTLASANVFNGIKADAKIIVPDNLYDTWITSNLWSAQASKIIKASEE